MKQINIEDISRLERPTIVTVGMFDGVHIGHQHLLQQLRSEGERIGLESTVVTFDKHPRQVLFPQQETALLTSLDERVSHIEDCGINQLVIVPFDEMMAQLSACTFAACYLIDRLNMKQLLMGYDNAFGNKQHDDSSKLESLCYANGVEITHDSAVEIDGIEVSSTKIRKALQEGNIVMANKMLGYPFTITGVVTHGRAIGRTIGFPTANIQPNIAEKIIPASGVYALYINFDNQRYRAMGNIGSKPTFHIEKATIEVHIFDFEGDIYGRDIQIEFVDYVRDIRAFENAAALSQQLKQDKAYISHLLDL